MEERVGQLSAAVGGADAQAGRIGEFAEQLEARAGALRFAEKRLAQFEEKLLRLEAAERALESSINALAARQTSVDAVRADLTRLFDTAERTVADMRTTTEGRQEVQAARSAFEEVLERARSVDAVAGKIEEHRADILETERRMGRLDALLSEVRASLEALSGQKVLVDHVIEKMGQLGFTLKEAEAVLAALREERDLASRIHEGIVALRQSKAG